MRMRYTIVFALGLFAAGCARQGPGPQFIPENRPLSDARLLPAPGLKIFIGDSYDAYVDVFGPKGGRIGQISGVSPNDVAVDASSNLWATDGPNYRVLMYPPPYQTPSVTLADTAGTPEAIAVATAGSQKGLVAVVSRSTSGSAALRFFAPGKTNPCKTLVLPAALYTITFDANDNLYGSGDYRVEEIGGGCKAAKIAYLKTGNSLSPGSFVTTLTPSGSIAVLSAEGESSVIYTYRPPVDGNLGEPVSTTSIPISDAFAFAITADGKDVWVLDDLNKQVDEFTFPGGKAVTNFAGNFDWYSIALSPPVVPH